MHRFDRRLGVAAVLLAVTALVATSLGATSSVGGLGVSAAQASQAATCKQHGSISYGTAGGGVPALDPNTTSSAAAAAVLPLLFNGITNYAPNGTVVPDIATKWKASKDLKTWWIYLRHDAKFANGRPFTSADAVANILRVLDPKVPSQARGNIKDIQSARAINKYEIRLRLGSPSSILPDQLFLTKMSDTTDIPNVTKSGIGTGPYRVNSYVPDQSLSLKPNPNWFGPKPCLKNISFLRQPDPTSMVTAFTSGKLDMIWQVPVSDVPKILADKNAHIIKPKTISSVQAWEVDTTSPPFNNVLARRALSYATNRDAMVKVAFLGQATASPTNNLINATNPAFNKKLAPYTFNLTKAQQLFNQAGVKSGSTLTFWAQAGTHPEWITMAQILQQDLKKIGINLDIKQNDISTWLAKFFPAGKKFPGMIVANFLSLQPNPILGLSFATSGKCECNWNNEAFDAHVKAAFGISDPVKRQAAYNHLQAMISQSAPVIAIAHQTNIVAAQNYVAGAWEDPRGNVHLENAYLTR
jgi:peptide/nickel transport system substrate-binding protein